MDILTEATTDLRKRTREWAEEAVAKGEDSEAYINEKLIHLKEASEKRLKELLKDENKNQAMIAYREIMMIPVDEEIERRGIVMPET